MRRGLPGHDFAACLRICPSENEERGTHVHIRNTPNFGSGIGALSDADKPSASTRRVSAGSITPSSHSRALE